MNAISKLLPSPAMLVAGLALMLSLGGVSYAAGVLPNNSVGTAQLQKNAVTGAKLRTNTVTTTKLGKDAVTSAKVKDGSLLAADFKAGQLPAGPQGQQGLTGPQGATGPAGPKGDAGPQGAPGLSAVEDIGQQTVNDSLGIKQVVLTCPVGKVVISGGAEVLKDNGLGSVSLLPVALDESTAINARTWVAQAHEVANTSDNWALRGQALCAKVG